MALSLLVLGTIASSLWAIYINVAKGFQLEWSIEGQKELSRLLQGMQNKLKDFTEPFKKTTDSLKKTYETEVFDTEGGVIGEHWERLSPYTVAQKARLGFGNKGILERTGTMRKSFKTMVSSVQGVVLNDTDYFKYHQSNQPRTKLPRRVMMKLAENQKQMIVKEFQKYIREKVLKK